MNIVFLNTSTAYGHKYIAANKKTELLARGLTACNNDVTIHNGVQSVSVIETDEDYKEQGMGRVISYAPHGPRLLEPLTNFKRLKNELKILKKNHSQNVLILLSPYLPIYEEYIILGKSLGYKIVVISHEWAPTQLHRNLAIRLFRKAYSICFGYGVDAILPISDFISDKISHFKKPTFKTPVLGDFSQPYLQDRIRNSGFVYCGTVGYERVFKILIEAYKIYCDKVPNPVSLTFILSGKEETILRLSTTFEKMSCKGKIKVLSKLTYKELYSIYQSASGLLLPLDPEKIQDRARFSQKIAEYISMGTPLITNPVGEINNYFKNKQNAIINPFSAEGFADSMVWITNHPPETEDIAEAGWQLGKKEFDYLAFGKKLDKFLRSL